MKTYILFVFGTFESHEEIEFFCLDVLQKSDAIHSIRYVIEGLKNIIVIFESNLDRGKLSNKIYGLLNDNSVNYYFMFEKDSLITAHLPVTINDLIFKPLTNETLTNFNNTKNDEMSLDDILDKIQNEGIEGLTKEEKNFLNNFES
jgi:hypothetical protein